MKAKTRTNQPVSGVVEDVVSSAETGTINKVLGIDTNGKLVKGNVSSGTKLYKHNISFVGLATTDTGETILKQCDLEITIISNQQQPYFNTSMTTYEVAEALSMLSINKINYVYASYHYSDNGYAGNYGAGNSIDLIQSQLGVFLKSGSYSYQNISFQCTNCSYTRMKENINEI